MESEEKEEPGSPPPAVDTEKPSALKETENNDDRLNGHESAHDKNDLRCSRGPGGSPMNGCRNCWWNSINTRLEVHRLPPPPKLISTSPLNLGRNGFTKPHSEHSPLSPLGLFHPNNGGYCVVNYSHRDVSGAFNLRPLSDAHRDLSFRRRLSSDGLFEMSPSHPDGALNSPIGRLSSDGLSDPSFLRNCSDGSCEVSLSLLPSPDTSRDQSFKRRSTPEGPREASLCPSMSPCPQPVAGSPFFIPSLPVRQYERLSPPAKQNQHKHLEVDSPKEENKYKCDICSSTFSLQRLLNRHMKTHSFYKRYHCQFCGKGFNDTFDLKRHIRTHTGIKPFKCDRCDKSFTQRCSLEAHMTRVHSVVHKYGFRERRAKMFVCEDCGKTFTENSEFMKHLHEYHPETEKVLRARRTSFSKDKIAQIANQVLH